MGNIVGIKEQPCVVVGKSLKFKRSLISIRINAGVNFERDQTKIPFTQ